MNSNLMFEFSVNNAEKTVRVTRAFQANIDLVWEAWTNPAILDQWWAPKPYTNKTKSMDFQPGGARLYSMTSPKGEVHWCRADFKEVHPQERYTHVDNFCDEQGLVLTRFPNSYWTNVFRPDGAATTVVDVTIQYESLESMEQILAFGFKEGFDMALQNLDQYLEESFRLRKESKFGNRARVSTYLNFDGKTEEAFTFYQTVFKTAFLGEGIKRFGEIPASPEHPPVADSIKNMVLHVALPITGNHILMGTDAPKEMGFNLSRGNNMHICIEPESRAEADLLFNALSEGGQVTMPMADMFFGAYFGEFSDQYGINWMINYQTEFNNKD